MIWPLFGPGLGMLLGGWAGYWLAYLLSTAGCFGTAAVFSGSPCSGDHIDQLAYSFIPFAGPWLNIAENDAEPIWPAIMGILQGVGLVLFIVGLSVRRTVEVEVRRDPAPQLRVELGSSPTGAPMLSATVEAF